MELMSVNAQLSRKVNNMAQSKEVAKKEETAVADFNPAMFEADAGGGLQDLGQEDLALPF